MGSCDVRRNDGTPMAPALLTMCDNDVNYFAAVPETAAFVFLKGGGSDTGEDYTGMAVSFFTCNDVVDSQTYVNECKDTPCHSENSYQCRDGDHDLTCMCKPGWEGKTCDTKTQ